MITVPRTGQSGVALLSVLWATMLIAGLFAALSLRVRGFAMTQSALEQRIRAGYAVEDATIRYLESHTAAGNRVVLPGKANYDIEGFTVGVAVQPASGLVDINKADVRLLAALFSGLVDERGRAERLAAAVVDWRDADKQRSLGGAEGDSYVSAGMAYVPRDAPFQSVQELSLVLGMTPALHRCAEGLVTVSSLSPLLDLRNAPERLGEVLRTHGSDYIEGFSELMRPDNSNSIVNPRSGNASGGVFALTFTATASPGFEMTRRVWVRITGDRRRPYEITHKEPVWASESADSDCMAEGLK